MLVVLATVAFGWVLLPFLGAIFWAVVIAIVFSPLYVWLHKRLNHRANLASFAAVVIVFLIVVIPLLLIALAILQEATALITSIQLGEIDLQGLFQNIFAGLPQWCCQRNFACVGAGPSTKFF